MHRFWEFQTSAKDRTALICKVYGHRENTRKYVHRWTSDTTQKYQNTPPKRCGELETHNIHVYTFPNVLLLSSAPTVPAAFHCSSDCVSRPQEALSLLRKKKTEYHAWNCRKEEVIIRCFVDYIPILRSLSPCYLLRPHLLYFMPY